MVRKIRNGILVMIAIGNMIGDSFSQAGNIPVVKMMSDSVFNPGDYVKIPIILFKFDQYGLDHSSNPMDSLKLIAAFLNKNEHLTVEIGNHTDYRVNPYMSSKPTFRRAKTIVDSLVIHFQINPGRVSPAGYSESRPKVLANDLLLPGGKTILTGTVLSQAWIDRNYPQSKNKDDYEFIMQQNRRTELKILRTDFEK